MSEISTINLEKCCRICLLSDVELMQIKNKVYNGVIYTDIYEMLTSFAFSEIEEISPMICEDCSFKIRKFYDFRELCISSNEKFQKQLSEFKKKVHERVRKEIEDSTVVSTWNTRRTKLNLEVEQPNKPKKRKKSENPAKDPPKHPATKEENETPAKPEEFHYVCQYCSKSFQIPSKLQIHLSMEHEELTRSPQTHMEAGKESSKKCLKCDHCSKLFSKKNGLRHHLETIHGPNRGTFVCLICQSRFQSEPLLIKHKILHDDLFLQSRIAENLEFKCILCKIKKFNNQEHLQCHYKKHKNEIFSCSICFQNFEEVKDYTIHSKTHQENAPYKCILCGQFFFVLLKFVDHLLVHKQVKPYSCKICQKKFLKLPKLRDHELSHAGASHLCSECGKFYKTKENLARHLIRHKGVRNFACGQCPKKFFFNRKYFGVL